MKTAALVAALLAPTACWALVGIKWKFEKKPSGGLKDVTFRINMADAPHVSGFCFAQQFKFHGVSKVGYIGLQPREDNVGGSVVRGVFSSLQKGSNSSHPNCHNGADGADGVSCAVDVNASYSPTYNLVVENISGRTWRGTLADPSSGQETVIGEWSLPSGARGIKSSQRGFVEYHLWNSNKKKPPSCGKLPKTQVMFGKPTTRTGGAGSGSVGDAYQHGDCKGKVAFKTSRISHTGGGAKVNVGF
ncbi:Uncharacterized protein TPAR_08383 [Tolypocladium paradoxum]|uniref:Uncharacterized protein n=1 Tax=Tolypocladium paradoxum TaxID=94208 RepID=A0A2S4KMK3_9HYPO|nr:Uncharacterized protein TPAR_08383 [Tolypocladium paradoxum]